MGSVDQGLEHAVVQSDGGRHGCCGKDGALSRPTRRQPTTIAALNTPAGTSFGLFAFYMRCSRGSDIIAWRSLSADRRGAIRVLYSDSVS